MKRTIAAILLMAMLMTLFPVFPVYAEDAAEEIASNVTEGTYTDNTAEAEESYEYTITGSDGTEYMLTTYAVPANTGNKITESTNGYYELLNSKSILTSGQYIIVGASSGYNDGQAISANSETTKLFYTDISDQIQDGVISIEDESSVNYIWTVTKKSDTTYTFQEKNGNYLTITNVDAVEGATLTGEESQFTDVNPWEGASNTWKIGTEVGTETGYLNNRNNGIGTWNQVDGNGVWYLYRYVAPGSSVDTSGLKALVAQLDPSNNYLKENDYKSDSWTAFEQSIESAQALISEMENLMFDSLEDANAALARVNQAYANLYNTTLNMGVNVTTDAATGVVSAGQEAIPAVVWQRTLESRTDSGETVMDVQTIHNNDDGTINFNTIEWTFGSSDTEGTIASLTTDPTMIMWDYGNVWYGYPTNAEYQDPITGLRASTWTDWDDDANAWQESSVRLISGQFIWPEGFDLDDSAVIESAEDADYQAIYDYINADANLKAEFEGDKVLPLNDDVYFFIRKEGETLTEENYMDHLVFWSGTSGKGVWSVLSDMDPENVTDWDRTELPTFNNQSALPAFYNVLPHINYMNATEDIPGYASTAGSTEFSQMEHTDKWYTMADTDAFMSTMRNLYTSVTAGEVFYIDVYCFDNSGVGGMDPLELKLIKNAETTATVQVNYYLNAVTDTSDSTHFLGTSYLTGQTVGEQLLLSAGTGTAQLNYRKAAAAAKAGTAVSDGIQINAPFIVAEGNNVINVLYTEGWPMSTYTYDFGVNNSYSFSFDAENIPEGANVTYSFTNVNNAALTDFVVTESGTTSGEFEFSFSVPDSQGRFASATVNATYGSGNDSTTIQLGSIFIYPASNVLYEENFIVKGSKWSDSKEADNASMPDASIVSDNTSTVYGYTSSYETSKGNSGVYSVTLSESDRYSDDLTFDFYGTGFDLIGTCGPDTGTLMVRLNEINDDKSTGAYVKGYLVDTAYNDVDYGTIYQVPIVHEQGLSEGSYRVTIRGAYIDYSSSATAASDTSARTVLGSNARADLRKLMRDMGLTDEQMNDVELINMDRLNGAAYSGARTTSSTISSTVESMSLEIDGFRVYRLANNAYYADTEKGLIYSNVMQDGITGSIAAYIEPGTNTKDSYEVTEYEGLGGPQNEIYLPNGSAVAIQLSPQTTYAQISARAVGEKSVGLSDGYDATPDANISHNTEMYYEVQASDDGLLVIGNTGEGLLALSNLKAVGTITTLNNGALATAQAMVFRMMNPNAETDEDVTVPDETTPEETTPEETKPDETTPEETTPEESKPEETTPEDSEPEEAPFHPDNVKLPFKDVEKGKWFYDGVAYVYYFGLMNGIEKDVFAPQNVMTRGMVVTVLYRLAGSPKTDFDAGYTDVPANKYYTDAVNWAAENGVAYGVGSNKFDPNAEVTREQLATMLYRYSQMMQYDLSGSADLFSFPDSDKVSGWAEAGMKWAVGNGIINGSKNGDTITIEPGANALRSQIAVILQRFSEKYR